MQQNHDRPGSSPNKIQACAIHRRHARSKSAPESRYRRITPPLQLRLRSNAATDAQNECSNRGTNVKLPHNLLLLKRAAVRSLHLYSTTNDKTGRVPTLDSRVRTGFVSDPKKVIPNS